MFTQLMTLQMDPDVLTIKRNTFCNFFFSFSHYQWSNAKKRDMIFTLDTFFFVLNWLVRIQKREITRNATYLRIHTQYNFSLFVSVFFLLAIKKIVHSRKVCFSIKERERERGQMIINWFILSECAKFDQTYSSHNGLIYIGALSTFVIKSIVFALICISLCW